MRIKLYDDKDNKILFDVKKIIDNGFYGIVYKLDDDKCLKRFTKDYLYDEVAFKKLMELDLPNFYKVYKMLYNSNYDFGGYIMKYYDKKDIDIITMPVDYTFENIIRLIAAAKKISDEGILIHDLHDGNIIMDDNMITVIDMDLYSYCNFMDNDRITKLNYGYIYSLFKELYFNSLYYNNIEDNMLVHNLFNEKEDVTCLVRKLAKYKYPIDYVIANQK